MSGFVNMVALAVPVFTLQVYDRVVTHAGVSTLAGFVIGMGFVIIFDYILRQTRSRIMQTVALRIDVLVGRQLFDKLMAMPLHVLEARPANYWQALFRDVDMVRNTVSGASALLICDLPFVIMFFGLILTIAWPVAWVLFVLIPLFMFVAWRSAAAMSAANQQERTSTLNRDGLIAEIIAGRTTIKALALDNAMRPMWEEKHAENIENSIVRGAKADFYSNFGGSLTMLTTVCMTSVGALAIISQELTMGALIATNMLSGRLIGPLNQLVGQWRTYNGFRQAVDRLGEVFNTPSERMVSEITLSRPEGAISIENVSFSYGTEMAPVVDQVSHLITPRGVHALVGRNGSGKTTLMKLIQGLYTPTNGRILLDGADIEQFSRTELAQWLGYVPQECVLFAGTIRENILHRNPHADDSAIISASTQAGVHRFIIDLPDGYATEIGEAGRRLSGGQRQRIAIARALLGDPPVLLLDEPSSSLDRQAEQELRKTLTDIGRSRTVIIVTHSPILLAACDNLVALDKGKVALAGPSKEILPRLFGQTPKGAQPPGPAAQPAIKPAAPIAPHPPLQPGSIPGLPPMPAADDQVLSLTPAMQSPLPAQTPMPATQQPPMPLAVPPTPVQQPAPGLSAKPLSARPKKSKRAPLATPVAPTHAAPPVPQQPAPVPSPPAPVQAAPVHSQPPQRPAPAPIPDTLRTPLVPPLQPAPPVPSTADPSVSSENMFNLQGSARELVDDPYADLVQKQDQHDPAPPVPGAADKGAR